MTWISSNEGFATVDENGLVRALKGLPVGDNYVTITAVTSNDRRADAEFSIKVDVLPEKVELDKHELLLKTGESYRLSAWVSPYNTTDKTLTWLSGDDAIATVSAEGEITALEAGITEIIVRVGPEGAYKYDTCKLTVVPAQVTVSFYDWDGTLLQQSQVPYGEMPQYTGEEPTRTSTAQFDYVFAGWDPEIVKAEADASYTATYSGTIRKYAISFYDWDGTLLQQSDVEYGQMPEYDGEEPTKESNIRYDYVFKGWNPELVEVKGKASYKATYSPTLRKYTISFYNWDGTLLQESQVEYDKMPEYTGPVPTRESISEDYDFVFIGWEPKIVKVTGDAEYVADYKEVESETGVIYINGIRYTQVVKYMDKKGNVFIVTPDGRKYNLNGKKLK